MAVSRLSGPERGERGLRRGRGGDRRHHGFIDARLKDPSVVLTYDSAADILGLWLTPGGGRRLHTVQVTPWVHVDLDERKHCVGFDLLDAKHQVPIEALRKLPPPGDWSPLAEAATESGLSPATLRVLINRGRLEGWKRGRDWLVGGASLWNYLEEREARGRQPRSAKGRRIRKLTSKVNA